MTVIVQGTRLRILSRILDGLISQGTVPGYLELMAITGISKNAVKKHLERLRALGLVTWDRGTRGTLRPTVRFIPAEELP